MADFLTEIEGAGRRYLCAISSLPDRFGALLEENGLIVPGDALREGLRRSICGRSGGQSDIPTPTPSFTGGQCVGTWYFVTVEARAIAYSTGTEYTAVYESIPTIGNPDAPRGPISGDFLPFPRVGGLAPGQLGPPLNGKDGSADGIYSLRSISNDLADDSILQTGDNQVLSARVVSVEPLSGGGPDNCGNLPVQDDFTGEDEIDPDDGPPVPIVIIPTSLTINGIGELNVTLDFSGAEFSAELNFDFSGEASAPISGLGDLAPAIPSGAPFPDPLNPEDPPDPRGSESNIIGLLVVASVSGRTPQTEIGGVGFPVLRVPRIGDVVFAIQVNGRAAWTVDQPLKLGKQFVPVNAPLFAYNWAVRKEPGWDIVSYPVTVRDKDCGPYYETPAVP